jgi:4-amino-4-deoxy-L-arabinose transferase-like glycosyltransferase
LEATLSVRTSKLELDPTLAMVGLSALLLCARLWVAGHTELMFDEAYYALWAKNLAWCYYDHPPMVALWIRLSTILFGEQEFGVRALGALAATAGAGLVYAVAQRLFADRSKAAFAALLYCSMLLISAGAIIITPDTPLVFFWSIALYALVRIYGGGSAGWWALVGVAMGFALQSKYTALLLGAGIPCAMILVPRLRIWWRHPAPYLAGAVAFAIFFPVIAWNYGHDWASFAMQFGRAQVHGLTLRFVGEFVASQIGLLTPFVFALAVGGLWLALDRRKDADSDATLFLASLIGPLMAYFLFHSLHARVNGNWTAPAYPTFAVLGSEAAFQIPSFHRRLRPVMAVSRRLAVPIGVALAAIVYLQVAAAPFPLAVAKDPTALMAGWSGLAREVEVAAQRENAAYVLTSRYRLNSELAYYWRGTVPVIQFNQRLRWIAFPQPPATVLSKPGLYVAEAGRELTSELCRRFSVVKKVGEISRRRHGKQIQRYVLYRLEKPTGPALDGEDSYEE